jgi:glycosyltransferase involved in cell wall biosynthesis
MIRLEPEYPDYEVIVPTFERPKMLDAFLGQVRHCNAHKPPKRVIVVDDGSSPETVESTKRLRSKHSDAAMRVALVLREEQGGYQAATRDGLSHVETKYAVVCADDVRLGQETSPGVFSCPSDPNPFVTLVYYLAGAERVRSNIQNAEEEARVPYPVGVVIPWGVKLETPGTVSASNREMWSLSAGILPLVTDQKSGFGLDALVGVEELAFYEGSVGAHYCFALDMNYYRSLGGLDPELDGPNMYSFWDYTLRARNTGVATYFTNRAVYMHRTQPYTKHRASLANTVLHGKTSIRTGELLLSRWERYSIAGLNRPINPPHTDFTGMMNNAWSG